MKRTLAAAVFAALVLASSAARAASVLTTAPAQAVGFGVGMSLYCQATNAGTKPIELTIDSVRFDGTVSQTQAQTVDPAKAASMLVTTNAAYCRFTSSGGKRAIRAAAIYYSTTTGVYLMAIPAQ